MGYMAPPYVQRAAVAVPNAYWLGWIGFGLRLSGAGGRRRVLCGLISCTRYLYFV